MHTLETKTVADYVVENIKTAEVFQKYHINYALNGTKNLLQVCENRNIEPVFLLSELKSIDNKLSFFKNYNTWSLAFLIDYIIKIHHQYVEDRIPVVMNLANTVCENYSKEYPSLNNIREIFLNFSIELTKQMKYEEYLVFPAIQELVLNNKYENKFETLIESSKIDHANLLATIKEIRNLTNHYTQPKIESKTLSAYFYTLKSFDLDFQKHLHLENNILFPKVLALLANINSTS
ncbi:DUF542 domain-containing protein [uncultured Polaribacter sp.]|uniref:DUF542 domain-containing protein n=1 Tax=uncultured Polaribacter sp. TaxID=174711 RepID=UPI00263A3C3A|nr:DUF542 domain-containing protein [uncultured Polaribacter sp.]